jgi:glycosyltransferase involved in cell wall biosynthesis
MGRSTGAQAKKKNITRAACGFQLQMKKRMRILHAPVEIAGQMGILSKAQRKLGYDAVSVCFYEHPFLYHCDRNLKLNKYHERPGGIVLVLFRKLLFFLYAIRTYDVFHFHFGITLLNRYIDLPLLRLLGKKVIMQFWGDDVRQSEIAEKKNPYYHLAGYIKDDRRTSAQLRKLSRYLDMVVVSNYELLEHVEEYFSNIQIVRQAVNKDDFMPAYPSPEKKIPNIVHAPSDRDIKGTGIVIQAIEDLKKRYDFHFTLVHGFSHDKAKEIYREADIIIDQLLLGDYGLFCIEAMALGKPVICYIRDDIRMRYHNLPVVNANPETVGEKIEMLLKDPVMRNELGKAGRRYVEENHDACRIAKQLIGIYIGTSTEQGNVI